MPTYELARNGIVIVQQYEDLSGTNPYFISYEDSSAPIELRRGDTITLEFKVLAVNFATGLERLNVYLRKSNDLYSWETGDPANPLDANQQLIDIQTTGSYSARVSGIGARFIRLHYLFWSSDTMTLPAPAVGTSVVFDAILSVTRSA